MALVRGPVQRGVAVYVRQMSLCIGPQQEGGRREFAKHTSGH